VPAAWFRRLGKPGLDERVHPDQRAFALGEIEQALAGTLSVLEPVSWLNEYWATRRAAVKLWQFQLIASLGIAYSPVIVSNDPTAVRSWMRRAGPSVYKSLHSPLLERGGDVSPRRFVFTSPVRPEDLSAHEELLGSGVLNEDAALALTPCQFQRRLDPAYELRVTSVDHRHFAVRLDHRPWPSQEASDWRAHPEKVEWRPYELPAEVTTQLDSLMDALSLDYGASDWVVDHDGEHVLLEVNPHGAWLWLEDELPGLGISQAIADALTERARRVPVGSRRVHAARGSSSPGHS
jgi:hypothetical protein